MPVLFGHKPIFLSVGYSTCYWCHVMEKQSFEDTSGLAGEVNTYTGRIWFHVPVTVSADAKPGALTLALNVKTQACDASRCLQPQTTTLRIPIQVDPDAAPQTRHPQIFHGATERDVSPTR